MVMTSPAELSRVLVVDDEVRSQDAIRRTLDEDFLVLTASHADEARELLERHDDVAVILCDQRMPGLPGVGFLKEVRERWPEIVRIVISGYTDSEDIIAGIQRSASQGGFVGTLVSRDQTSAMIVAELAEVDKDGNKIDYVAYNDKLEGLRKQFEDADFEIQIIGFAKQIGDIADGASSVLEFCAVALLLTAAAVYWYCHSLRFTILPIVCSFTSLVWQFGALRLLG